MWLLANWKIALAGVAAMAVVALAWQIQHWRHEAERADVYKRAVDQMLEQQEKSHSVGINLETGLNDYRPKAREIDKKVQNAPNRIDFDVERVQRTAERIAAGNAARQRHNQMP